MYKEKILSIEELTKKGYRIEPTGILVENRLKEVLNKSNWNVIDLSDRTGMSRQTLHNIMNGSYTPGIEMVLKIAAVCQLPIEDIFYLHEDAWFSRVKKAGERTLYVDVIHLTIYDKEAMSEEIRENGYMYYDMQENRMMTEGERETFLNMQLEETLYDEEALYSLIGDKEKVDKRSIHRLLKEKLEEMSAERFVPKYQKLVKTIPR